jgi:flagellin
MRIQHNIMAMNAYRNYNTNTSALSGNLEKLSSGYKINRAGDDAAGLAISEKMRAQISGLEQASSNVKDGISLVKTGEGAMQEIQDMLNRMVTLATQSANGTYDDSVDRANLQKEVDNLTDEINRIADSANFNGIKLLDGSLQSGSDTTVSSDMGDLLPKVGETLGTNTILHVDAPTSNVTSFDIDLGNLSWTAATSGDVLTITFGGKSFTWTATGAKTYGASTIATKIAAKMTSGQITDANGNKFTFKAAAAATKANTVKASANGAKITITQGKKPTSASTSLSAPLAVTVTKTAGSWGTTEAAGQDYNVSVTNIQNASFDGGARLGSTSFNLTASMATEDSTITIGNTKVTFTTDKTYKTPTAGYVYTGDLDLKTEEGLTEAASRLTKAAESNDAFTVGYDGSKITLVEKKMTAYGTSETYDLRTLDGFKKALSYSSAPAAGNSLSLQIGDTADDYNQLNVSINDMHVQSLGISGIDISKQDTAAEAIDKIKAAINSVSSTRGDLGAIQNRLEHTANNLSVMTENIQDAESTIRDTDIAEEMMAYTKNNILVQSAQAMLAQANTVPQGVLQLLQ